MDQRAVTHQGHETIFNMLFTEDEITWQSMIYTLIQEENMNPWDIDVSRLAQKFLDNLKQLKETDFRISGKMVLAAALLLKIKSKRFLDLDIAALDQLIAETEEPIDLLEDLEEDLDGHDFAGVAEERPKIYPKTPQPRKRKVSVYDLVQALEKALEVEHRRKPVVREAPEVKAPEKTVDMQQVIKTVYGKVKTFFAKKTTLKLTFDQICQSDKPIDKVMTFVPLLHLENQRKIDLQQEDHFGEIGVEMVRVAK